MIKWFAIFLIMYICLLIYAALKSKKSIHNLRDYFLAGTKVGAFLGFLTFSATLFSTFTLMGMPDFFRQHGVGAWIFLGVTDTALAFVVLWFGIKLRQHISISKYQNISTIIEESYNSKIAKYIFLLGIFVFLIPYVSIQIKGVADFLSTALPINIPVWIWASGFLLAILLYSYYGGLKAIMYSDAYQGILLLIVTAIIAIVCVEKLGGIENSFEKVREINPQLNSIPGPNGLLTPQFLVASFLAIILMPISQPQLFTRLIIIKDNKNLKIMAVSIGFFAFFIILPTVFIGIYGSINYPNDSASTFLVKTLTLDQNPIIGALAIVGLIAAAMSTADSQLFALESEVTNFNNNNPKTNHKYIIVIFSLISLILALWSTKELALLARVSFAGTSLLAPMIILGIFSDFKHTLVVPVLTGISLILYLLSNLFTFIPTSFLGLRLDLLLLILNAFITFVVYILSKNKKGNL